MPFYFPPPTTLSYPPSLGPLSAPAMPSSGVAIQNTFSHPVVIYVISGTVSQIAVGKTAGGVVNTQQSPSYQGISNLLSPGDWIAITYSVLPAWTWFGI